MVGPGSPQPSGVGAAKRMGYPRGGGTPLAHVAWLQEGILRIGAVEESAGLRLSWGFACCGRHRDMLLPWPRGEEMAGCSQVKEEHAALMERFGSGPITAEVVREAHYTLAVINESLRSGPPVSIVLQESLKPLEIMGYYVPKGATLELSLMAPLFTSGRGDTGASFDVGNLEAGRAKALQQDKAFLPFGAGPRYCAGKWIAILELQVLLAILAREGVSFGLTSEGLAGSNEFVIASGIAPPGSFATAFEWPVPVA